LVTGSKAVFAALLVAAFTRLPVIPILAWFAHLPWFTVFARLPVLTRLTHLAGLPIVTGGIAQRTGLAVVAALAWFAVFPQFTRFAAFAGRIVTVFTRLAWGIGARLAAIPVFTLARLPLGRAGLIGTGLAGSYGRGKRCGSSNRFRMRFSCCLHGAFRSEGYGCLYGSGISAVGGHVSSTGAVDAIALAALRTLI
jgi:hypothetical protein